MVGCCEIVEVRLKGFNEWDKWGVIWVVWPVMDVGLNVTS